MSPTPRVKKPIFIAGLITIILITISLYISKSRSGGSNYQTISLPRIITTPTIQPEYKNYCSFRENLLFKLEKADGYSEYYIGNEIIEGEVFQKTETTDVLFVPWGSKKAMNRPERYCPFILTKNFKVDKSQLERDFNLSSVWEEHDGLRKKPKYSLPGTWQIEGYYKIKVRGFGGGKFSGIKLVDYESAIPYSENDKMQVFYSPYIPQD